MSAVGAVAAQAASGSDTDLVRAVRAGDDEAFEELYRRYRDPITRFVMSLVHDEGRAEDLTQEAFVSALRGVRQSDREIRFKPWIYEIAKNAALDHRRRASRATEVPLGADGAPGAGAWLRPTAATAPEASFLEREQLDHLCGAMGELSENAQRLVVLRDLEGLSYREIGERMQLSSGAVESRLFRARRKLEHEYELIDTGRRCALMRPVIARMAEGVGSGRDRRRLARHVRSCWPCRRSAHELGVRAGRLEPRSRRAGALLPFPGLLHRLLGGPRSGSSGARDAAGMLSSPATETVVQGVHKAAVVLASAIAIGGGATLGGVGPLARGGDGTAAHPQGAAQGHPTQAGARKEPPTAGSRGRGREHAPLARREVAGRSDAYRSGAGDRAPAPSSSPGAAAQRGAPPAGPGGVPAPGTPTLHGHAAPRLPSLPGSPSLPDESALPDTSVAPDVPDAGVVPTAGLVPDTSEVPAPARDLLPTP